MPSELTPVTEEEARKKWCPFARPRGDGTNRNTVFADIVPDQTECIASQCMAWRGEVHFNPLDEPTVTSRGYCGLAGKGY